MYSLIHLAVSFEYVDKDKLDCEGCNLAYKICNLVLRNIVLFTPSLKYFCNFFSLTYSGSNFQSSRFESWPIFNARKYWLRQMKAKKIVIY